jgi:hypothetical protein
MDKVYLAYKAWRFYVMASEEELKERGMTRQDALNEALKADEHVNSERSHTILGQ